MLHEQRQIQITVDAYFMMCNPLVNCVILCIPMCIISTFIAIYIYIYIMIYNFINICHIFKQHIFHIPIGRSIGRCQLCLGLVQLGCPAEEGRWPTQLLDEVQLCPLPVDWHPKFRFLTKNLGTSWEIHRFSLVFWSWSLWLSSCADQESGNPRAFHGHRGYLRQGQAAHFMEWQDWHIARKSSWLAVFGQTT